MPTKKHFHRYRRRTSITLKGKKWERWFCTLPECTHWVQNKEDLFGKKAICYYCQEEFIITPDHLDRAKVGCMVCRKEFAGKVMNIPKGKLDGLGSVQSVNADDESDMTIAGLSLEEILSGKK